MKKENKVILSEEMDIIDFYIDNTETCKGRKIITDEKMIERLGEMADEVKATNEEIYIKIVCPETGNLTEIYFKKDLSNDYVLTKILADDIQPLSQIDETKPLYIINEEYIEDENDMN